MRSIQWQLGVLGTISEFAYRHRETKKNLCRGGRSQDRPDTDFYSPANPATKVWCKNTETCRSNFNINFVLLLCAFVGILININ